MPPMDADSPYHVGVPEFDDDHQHLFAMATELREALVSGKSRGVLRQVLLGLAAMTQQHFAAEERAMERSGFPELAIHAEEHLALTARFREFVRAHEAGDTGVAVEVSAFLYEWLDKHIVLMDRRYAEHLKQR
jgi:hemerythrin